MIVTKTFDGAYIMKIKKVFKQI